MVEAKLGINIPENNPSITPDKSAKSFEIIFCNSNTNEGCKVLYASLLTLFRVKLASKKLIDVKYESVVFMKFEQQMSGIIIAIYFNALEPSLEIDENTKKNIMNGKANIKTLLIARLKEYKKDFTSKGSKSANKIEKANTPKNIRGIAKFLIFE